MYLKIEIDADGRSRKRYPVMQFYAEGRSLNVYCVTRRIYFVVVISAFYPGEGFFGERRTRRHRSTV